MSTDSKIEWTDASWNPVTGCTHASPGCDNCYAKDMTYRLEMMGQTEKYGGLTVLNGRGDRHFNGVVRCHEDALDIPLHWKDPRQIFVNSMSDLFHKDVPYPFVAKCFGTMGRCLQHTFQILTKRPEIAVKNVSQWMADQDGRESPPGTFKPLPNVWIGTSIESQKYADERIPHLLKVPAAIRFLSVEPLLESVDLISPLRAAIMQQGWPACPLHWVIVGGESGGGARPCNIHWIREIVAQCKSARIPCFVKQLGSKPYLKFSGSHEESRPGFNMKISVLDFDTTIKLKHRKGGDPKEWPKDLQVREFPGKPEPFTRITLIKPVSGGGRRWIARCGCGRLFEVERRFIDCGRTKSCGKGGCKYKTLMAKKGNKHEP